FGKTRAQGHVAPRIPRVVRGGLVLGPIGALEASTNHQTGHAYADNRSSDLEMRSAQSRSWSLVWMVCGKPAGAVRMGAVIGGVGVKVRIVGRGWFPAIVVFDSKVRPDGVGLGLLDRLRLFSDGHVHRASLAGGPNLASRHDGNLPDRC